MDRIEADKVLQEWTESAPYWERFLNFRIEAPISPDEFWKLRSATSATLREKLADLSKEQTVQVAREVKDAALAFFPNGYMSFPARMIIVTARKP